MLERTMSQLFKRISLFCFIITITQSVSVAEVENGQKQQEFRLDCEPGEQRHFNYESSTKVWGSSNNQQVRIKASLRLRCLEPPSPQTLKYLAEVLEISSDSGLQLGAETKKERRLRVGGLATSGNRFGKLEADARAEPVLDEVGQVLSETADKVTRSVSGWFTKTWGSVKDFFTNIFNTSERTNSSRDEVLKESGLDIAQQCRAGKAAGKPGTNAIDDSVFDDLEPKYYIGASSLDGNTAFEFTNVVGRTKGSNGKDEDEEDEDANLSFFDGPKRRTKRSSSSRDEQPQDYERLIRVPFVMVQARTGKMLELKFAHEDSDVTVRNFKRHLCDLFATNLDRTRNQTSEVSPIGKHNTSYLSSTNSSAIEQSLLQVGASKAHQDQQDHQSNKQLVRVLALVGMQTAGGELELNDNNHTTNGARDPMGGLAGDQQQLSVLRSINSTSKLQVNGGAGRLSPQLAGAELDQLQVRMKQVQQINEGRMTGSAGTLGMSLVSSLASQPSMKRSKRSTLELGEKLDMAELVQVSSSFAMQLVPVSKLGKFLGGQLDDDAGGSRGQPKRTRRETNTRENKTTTATTGEGRRKREPLVEKGPKDAGARERLMEEWRQLERRLRLAPANLQTESSQQDGHLQRLEVLRDELQLRLNEELLRNRVKRKLRRTAASRQAQSGVLGHQRAADGGGGGGDEVEEGGNLSELLGLSLSQLLLNSGLGSAKVAKRPNLSVALEELLELEATMGEDQREGSMSRLIRETARVDKLRQHCRSAMFGSQKGARTANLVEFRQPFNVGDDGDVSSAQYKHQAPIQVSERDRKKVGQCKQVLQVLLRVSQRQAVELALELMDECNERMQQALKWEELGYGPSSRHFRQLRQQLAELMGLVERPSELLLDKLFARLHYKPDWATPAAAAAADSTTRAPPTRAASNRNEPEFTYVRNKPLAPSLEATSYNKSLLMSEDDYNNNDGSGSLVMTLTQLAAKASVGRTKRSELVERLLQLAQLAQANCSPYHGPQLDILESLGNLHEPLEETQVARVVQLARRCRHQDQYLVGAVHALQGQLASPTSQRFLADLIRSPNASCTVKSEIVLTLTGAILVAELKQHQQQQQQPPAWPASGTSRVDQELVELMEAKGQARAPDRRCLGQLIAYYMRKKGKEVGGAGKRRRSGRQASWNEDKFWDEANCRRWAVPLAVVPNATNNATTTNATFNIMGDELADGDDNNLIFGLLSPPSNPSAGANRSGRAGKSQRLLERELDPNEQHQSNNNSNAATTNVRHRHKCTASKSFGPKNAAAHLRAELVNELVGPKDENKFLARFRLAANFLGHQMDVGRMYLWHQRRTTRAHVNILGKSLWDTSHGCHDQAPKHLAYMPLFDFSLWLVKVSVGLRLHTEMGFFSSCQLPPTAAASGGGDPLAGAAAAAKRRSLKEEESELNNGKLGVSDGIELYPTISLRASGEATAKFVVARAGMSLASQYGYQGSIRVSQQPQSCMSIQSGHQPMNVTFSSWLQLWDGDCHYWGPRDRHQPQATKWRLAARKPSVWLENECLLQQQQPPPPPPATLNSTSQPTMDKSR